MKRTISMRIAAVVMAFCIALATMPMRVAAAEDAPRSGQYAIGGDVYYIDANSAAVMCRRSGRDTEIILDDGIALGLFASGGTLYASVMRDNTPCRVAIAFTGGETGRTFAISQTQQDENAAIIYDFLVGEGQMSSAAACGILSNIFSESTFDPNIEGDKDANGVPTSYGICQWHLSRLDALKAYCSENGYDYTTLDGQLRYLLYDLNTGYKVSVLNNLKIVDNNAEGAYWAAYYFCYFYEAPANIGTQSANRGVAARDSYWQKYGDESVDWTTGDIPAKYSIDDPDTYPAYPKKVFSSSVNYYDVYHVKFIQLAMNDLLSAGLHADGIFGSATATAVKSFQTANGLDVDGIVGSGSWNKMLELLAAKYSAPQVETYSISGSVASFGDSSAATDIALLSGSTQIDCVSTASGSYLLSDVTAGTYTLSVSKANHVTREYSLTVSGDTVQDVTICLVGDVTCDGDVTTRDLNRIYAHVSEISPLTGYDLACADVVGSDGEATTRDLNRIYAHVSEISPLW